MAAQQFPWGVTISFVGVFIGWMLLWLTARRLKLIHPNTWLDIGRPSGLPIHFGPLGHQWRAWESNFLLLGYSYWGVRLTGLNDGSLTLLVWCTRIIAVIGVVLLLIPSKA
jgi:hypothetical protein